jgi:hypothetical protein
MPNRLVIKWTTRNVNDALFVRDNLGVSLRGTSDFVGENRMRAHYRFGTALLLIANAFVALGQAAESASKGPASVIVGVEGEAFQPSFYGEWNANTFSPISTASKEPLLGIGTFAEIKRSRWIQIEASARWLRFNPHEHIYQDNYLIGPRFQIIDTKRIVISGKAQIGISNMGFDVFGGHGHYTSFAFGGSAEVPLGNRLYLRFADVEYQYWPKWGTSHLSPYGCGFGIGYRLF